MKLRYLILLLLIWIIVLTANPNSLELVKHYWHFFFVGIIGAIVANSTGAGGGIIFIPFFSALGITTTETLATSILIQSFGMTAGSIGWLISIKAGKHFSRDSLELQKKILIITALPAIIGVLCAQYIVVSPPYNMIDTFRIFSVVFGAALLLITLLKKAQSHTRHHLNFTDQYLLITASFIGGLITAWISIGIGELIAIILILRHIPIMIAVSTAVCLSAITVIAAAPYHVALSNPIWEIVLFAAPAAVIGGTVARFLSFRLGPIRLKIFFATWILATGLSM